MRVQKNVAATCIHASTKTGKRGTVQVKKYMPVSFNCLTVCFCFVFNNFYLFIVCINVVLLVCQNRTRATQTRCSQSQWSFLDNADFAASQQHAALPMHSGVKILLHDWVFFRNVTQDSMHKNFVHVCSLQWDQHLPAVLTHFIEKVRGVSTMFPSLANISVVLCTKFAILGEGVLGSSWLALQCCP